MGRYRGATPLPHAESRITVPFPLPVCTWNRRIPRRIHQTWMTHRLPEHMERWSRSWRLVHPGWEYRLWNDTENRCAVLALCIHVYARHPWCGWSANDIPCPNTSGKHQLKISCIEHAPWQATGRHPLSLVPTLLQRVQCKYQARRCRSSLSHVPLWRSVRSSIPCGYSQLPTTASDWHPHLITTATSATITTTHMHTQPPHPTGSNAHEARPGLTAIPHMHHQRRIPALPTLCPHPEYVLHSLRMRDAAQIRRS